MATKKSCDEWAELFNLLDKDKSGALSYVELKELIKKGNSNLCDSQLKAMFVFFDGPDGDQQITLQEFKNGIMKIVESIKQLKALFNEIDTDHSGCLSQKELRQVLESSDHKVTDEEAQAMFKKGDISGDGKITFDEFIQAFT